MSTTDTLTSRRRRALAALFPSLLASGQLLVFGPRTIHAANRAEIAYSFPDLLPTWLPWLVGVTALAVAIASLLPRTASSIWTSLWTALGILLWGQGNLGVAAYGELDGGGLDFTVHAHRAPWEIAVWIAVVVAAVATHRRVVRLGPTLCAALVALQTAALPFAPSTPTGSREAWTPEAPPDALFAFSERQNALLVVLDAFQSDVFAEILDEDPEAWQAALDGFTYYEDHLGAFPTTKFSIPVMLTGTPYDNRRSSWSYLEEALEERSVLHHLTQHGWESDLMSISRPFVRRGVTHGWIIPRPYTQVDRHQRAVAAQLVDLAAFRHLPHPGKRWVYNDEAWQLQRWFTVRPAGYHAVHSLAFLDDFRQRMHVGRDRPVMKAIHVGGAHPPIVLDAECRVRPPAETVTREGFRDQARCALRGMIGLLDDLRTMGLYERSLIIIASDHGIGLAPPGFGGRRDQDLAKVAGRAAALLLVKEPGAAGPLQRSVAPTAMADLPATICEALGIPHTYPGTPVTRLDPTAQRPRYFGQYAWTKGEWKRNDLAAIHWYRVNGNARRATSWHYQYSDRSEQIPLPPPPILFGRDPDDPRLGPGWAPRSRPDGETAPTADGTPDSAEGRWAQGDEAVVFLPLGPGAGRIDVTLAGQISRTVDIEVMLDETTIANWSPRGNSVHRLSASFDADPRRADGPSTVVFRFRRPDTDDGLRVLRFLRLEVF